MNMAISIILDIDAEAVFPTFEMLLRAEIDSASLCVFVLHAERLFRVFYAFTSLFVLSRVCHKNCCTQ